MMRRRSFLTFATVALATPAFARPLLKEGVAATPVFALDYRAGPRWIAGAPVERQNLRGHRLYMQRLLREGRLIRGLPANGERGRAIIRAGSLAEARAILAADPAVISGVFAGTAAEWT